MRLTKLFGLLLICLIINAYFLINKTVEANNNTFNQSCLSPAKINKVTPESAKITENIEITVKGENFTQTTRIFLGDSETSNVSVKSTSELTFRIPDQNRPGRRTLSILTECGLTQHPFVIFPEALENVELFFLTTVLGTSSIYVGDGKPEK